MNKSTLIAIVAFVAGSFLTFTINSSQKPAAPPVMDHSLHDTSMSMDGMVEALKGKTADEFDKEFIRLMIEHHKGAIDMAIEAQKSAKHEEIKQLSEEIISAQTKEIKQMKEWNKNWGYSK